MIQLLLVAAATVVTCEIVLRCPLPRHLAKMAVYARKAAALVRSGQVSDHWKERILPTYAGRIMAASLGLLFWLCVVALPLIGVAVLVKGSLAAGTAWLIEIVPLCVMTSVAAVWIWGRRRLAG